MKKMIIITLMLFGVFTLAACNNTLQQGSDNMQYFFDGKIVEVDTEYLILEVNDIGNTALCDDKVLEVSTDVIATSGCPDFVVGEYARILLAKNVSDDTFNRLEALSIYKVDETGAVIKE